MRMTIIGVCVAGMVLGLIADAWGAAASPQAPGKAREAKQSQQPQPEAKWVDPDTSAPSGTVYKTFRSKTIGEDVSYLIYLPPSYETAKDKKYPVVYWLHGVGGNQRGGQGFVKRLDDGIKAGTAPELIVVLVNGLRDSRYYDSKDGKRPVETVIIKDLIPYIDATYRTYGTREMRAIEGFSMGGFGSAHLGFKYPELFGAVSIMGGALLGADNVATTKPELFEKNFGGSLEYFATGDPWNLVEKNADKIRGKMLIRIHVGAEDALCVRNEDFHKLLDKLNIANEFGTVPNAAHEGNKVYDYLGAGLFDFYKKAFEKK